MFGLVEYFLPKLVSVWLFQQENPPQQTEDRRPYNDIVRENEKFIQYYKVSLGILLNIRHTYEENEIHMKNSRWFLILFKIKYLKFTGCVIYEGNS